MFFYYILLWMTRFHSDPRVGLTLLNLGGMPITVVKIFGSFTVLAAMVMSSPKNAAVRRASGLEAAFLAFAIIPVVATIAFGYQTPSITISSLISFALMLFATRIIVCTKERMFGAVRVMTLASGVATLWIFKAHFLQHMSRPPGLEQDPNYEALTLVAGIPVALWILQHDPNRWWRRIGLGCAVAMVGGVVLTESRAGLIAGIVIAIATLVKSRRKIVAFALVGIATFAVLTFGPSDMFARFHSIKISGDVTNGDDQSTRIHVELIKAGLNMIESSPIFGVGLEQFKKQALFYNRELLGVAGRSYVAHNTYVQIGAEAGLPVLALYLVMIGMGIKNCTIASRVRTADGLGDLASAMDTGIIAFATAAVSVSAPYVSALWLLIFLSSNLREIAASEASPQAANPNKVKTRPTLANARTPAFGESRTGPQAEQFARTALGSGLDIKHISDSTNRFSLTPRRRPILLNAGKVS
jgi:O-antigen ligase